MRVRLCQWRLHNKCLHTICCSVSFTLLHISFSFMCVILCNWVPENFNVSELSSLVFRILIRSMSRVVVNSFVVQDLQTLMSPRPCYPLVTVVFHLMEKVIYILFDCFHWVSSLDFLVVIGRAHKVQVVQHLDDNHLVTCPVNPCESSHFF